VLILLLNFQFGRSTLITLKEPESSNPRIFQKTPTTAHLCRQHAVAAAWARAPPKRGYPVWQTHSSTRICRTACTCRALTPHVTTSSCGTLRRKSASVHTSIPSTSSRPATLERRIWTKDGAADVYRLVRNARGARAASGTATTASDTAVSSNCYVCSVFVFFFINGAKTHTDDIQFTNHCSTLLRYHFVHTIVNLLLMLIRRLVTQPGVVSFYLFYHYSHYFVDVDLDLGRLWLSDEKECSMS